MKIYNTIINQQRLNTTPTETNGEKTEVANADILNYLTYTPAALSFQCTRKLPLQKINVLDENNQILINKIKNIIEKIQPGTDFPIRILKSGDKSYAFQISKKASSETSVVIKDMIDDVKDWKKFILGQTELSFTINPEGKIMEGSTVKKVKKGFEKSYRFYRNENGNGRIKTYDGLTLQQAKNSEDIWNTKPDLCKNKVKKEFVIDKHEDFKGSIAEILPKLGNRRVSLFA